MSERHPIVAVTGSSGAGTTTVRHAFHDIFRREGITAAFVEGEAFQRYEFEERMRLIRQAQSEGRALSLFGPEMHQLDRLETFFKEYSEHGTGRFGNMSRPTTRTCSDCLPALSRPGRRCLRKPIYWSTKASTAAWSLVPGPAEQ